LHFLARRNAFRFHVSDKLIDPRIAMQALDVGINLRLSRTPSRVSGILECSRSIRLVVVGLVMGQIFRISMRGPKA
jgi:hypothetical protein